MVTGVLVLLAFLPCSALVGLFERVEVRFRSTVMVRPSDHAVHVRSNLTRLRGRSGAGLSLPGCWRGFRYRVWAVIGGRLNRDDGYETTA